MKKFFWLFVATFALSNLLLVTSCTEDDGTDPINDIPPAVSISNISETIVDPGTVVSFTVTADKGTNDMNSFTVQLDGANLSTDDYTVDEITTLNNPHLLTGNDANNFVYNVNVTAPADAGTYIYDVIVADNKANTGSDFFSIEVNDPSTPISMELSGILLNQAGPAGTGGLDLDDGTGTGSANTAAEIRDLGIDCTIPTGQENWVGEFGTVNGAEMVRVDVGAVENFTFDNASSVEAIVGAYDTGFTLEDGVSTAPNCDETAVTDVTDGAAVGDMFVVLSNGVYYLLRIDEINAIGGSNGDNFVFSIKY